MSNTQNILCQFMADFFQTHFQFIKKSALYNNNLPEDKEDFIEEIKTDPHLAIWALDELCQYLMDKPYLRQIYINSKKPKKYGFSRTIKINQTIIKFRWDVDHYIIKTIPYI